MGSTYGHSKIIGTFLWPMVYINFSTPQTRDLRSAVYLFNIAYNSAYKLANKMMLSA